MLKSKFHFSIPTQDVSALTTGHGAPIADKLNSMSIGPRGPLLIQDHAFLEEMAHFDRSVYFLN